MEYIVDTASMTEITLDTDWKEQANQRIDNIRKNNVQLK